MAKKSSAPPPAKPKAAPKPRAKPEYRFLVWSGELWRFNAANFEKLEKYVAETTMPSIDFKKYRATLVGPAPMDAAELLAKAPTSKALPPEPEPEPVVAQEEEEQDEDEDEEEEDDEEDEDDQDEEDEELESHRS